MVGVSIGQTAAGSLGSLSADDASKVNLTALRLDVYLEVVTVPKAGLCCSNIVGNADGRRFPLLDSLVRRHFFPPDE